jgi:hypothetical protein
MVHPNPKQLYETTIIEVTELGIERVQRGWLRNRMRLIRSTVRTAVRKFRNPFYTRDTYFPQTNALNPSYTGDEPRAPEYGCSLEQDRKGSIRVCSSIPCGLDLTERVPINI